MGFSVFRVFRICSFFGLVGYIILFKAFKSNPGSYGLQEDSVYMYLNNSTYKFNESQHINILETEEKYTSDIVNLNGSESKDFHKMFKNTSQYVIEEDEHRVTRLDYSIDDFITNPNNSDQDEKFESDYSIHTDYNIEDEKFAHVGNNASLDIKIVSKEVVRDYTQIATIMRTSSTMQSHNKLLHHTSDAPTRKENNGYDVNAVSITKDVNGDGKRDCMSLITKLPPTKVRPTQHKKQIMWFDVNHNGNGLRNSINRVRFHRCKGEARNCEFLPFRLTHPFFKKDSTVGPFKADAVLFQGCHYNLLPFLRKRDNNQVFVMAEREHWWAGQTSSDFNRKLHDRHISYYIDKFNWTMTYRFDSDIRLSYGQILPIRKFKDNRDYASIYRNKRFPIVWLVSHCNTLSMRELYVKELMKYIPVHIYGQCGTYQCPKHDLACLNRIIKTYKFVLSFENTYHTNYVTEKLFDWFPRSIVPVVRGGETDYSRHGVPDGTIIDAERFKTPKDLATYLLRIGNDKDKYTNMLKRKAGYKVVSKNRKYQQAYCDLCKKLNTLDDNRQYYNHVGYWFASTYDKYGNCEVQI